MKSSTKGVTVTLPTGFQNVSKLEQIDVVSRIGNLQYDYLVHAYLPDDDDILTFSIYADEYITSIENTLNAKAVANIDAIANSLAEIRSQIDNLNQ